MQEDFRQLLDKYIDGSCTDAEKALVETWYASFETAEIRMFRSSRAQDQQRQRTMLLAVRKAIRQQEQPKRFNVFSSYPFRVAASVLIIIGLSLTYLVYQSHYASTALREQTASYGRIKAILLEDGSKVWLNAGSKLVYPETFGRFSRQVLLEGEGFFEVSPNAQKPFIVYTSRTTTQVVGTSFNINAYPGETRQQILVRTGRVNVTRHTDNIYDCLRDKRHRPAATLAGMYLVTGQGTVLENQTFLNVQAGTAAIDAWRTGNIAFNDTPLPQVIKLIERRFNTTVLLKNKSLSRCVITARYDNQPVEKVMESVAYILGASVTKTNNRFELSGKGCP